MNWFQKHTKLSKYTDQELIELFKDTKNQQYLAELYQRYVELIYGVCLKYFKHPETSKDHTLSIYEQLKEKVTRFDIQNFRSWLYVLVKNSSLQKLRQSQNGQTVELESQHMQYGVTLHPIDMEEDLYPVEHLNNCINQLPEKQKKVIELFYYKKMSYQEISDEIQVPKDKVRSYIQNGRRNLKICMEKKNELSRKNI